VQCLKAMYQADQGQAPKETLEKAQAYYWTCTTDPRPPALRNAHMVMYWLMAKRARAKGLPPDAPLAEALKQAGHMPDSDQDYFMEVMDFKASVEAARFPSTRLPAKETQRLAGRRSAGAEE
jgi:hypothetical protein